MKTYQVKTWNAEGALSNSYLVDLETPGEVAELKRFLKKKNPLVMIHRAEKPTTKRGAR